MLDREKRRKRRHRKIRKKIVGTGDCPRLCVYKSLKHIYAQLVDDKKGKVIVSASEKDIEDKKKNKTEAAFEVGKALAKEASDKKIKKVVFDRGGYRYFGRVKAVAEGARKGGLKF